MIPEETLKLARQMGISREELESALNDFRPDVEKLTDFYQEMLGLPYESSEKTKRMVVCDNRSCHDPGYSGRRRDLRSRTQRRRDHLSAIGRANVQERVSLSGDSEDRLAARVRDDAIRIVSEDIGEGPFQDTQGLGTDGD